jgi:CcmD family protein
MLFWPAAAYPQSQPPPKPPAQEEFVPLSEIPPEEQIPAFSLVAIAYALVWLALLGYVWSVARRLQKVETELATLSRKH